MRVAYANLMRRLWNLSGQIGALGESDPKYARVYQELSKALDAAEQCGLIVYIEDDERFTKQKSMNYARREIQ